MTSKTHVALGLLTGLIIIGNNPSLDTYTVISGVAIGSLIPDLDTKHSDPAQIFPPIAWIVDKFTTHRGFTHMMLPLIFLLAHYYYGNRLFWWLGIGGLTHLILDLGTKLLKITCDSGGEQAIFVLLWVGIAYMLFGDWLGAYKLKQYIPHDIMAYVEVLKMKVLAIK
jgi:uncharacterized metal-binding protein